MLLRLVIPKINISAVVMAIYEKWVWRIIPLGTPVLKKHYSGTLKSSYDGVERSATLEYTANFSIYSRYNEKRWE